ncbi:MAG: hypothetical protein QY323_04080 [Patescibacteria group bacterium]|nr:MAG: hypothetical protein QY323_04080 [Patescibacteria group bacterium]
MFGSKKLEKSELGRRLAAFSGTEKDQQDWESWLTAKAHGKERIWHEFKELMTSDARQSIKVRVLTAMLCWDAELDPFGGRGRTEFRDSSLYGSRVDSGIMSKVPDPAAVIVRFCLEAIDAGATAPEYARDQYNSCVPHLLAIVTDEALSEGLFERFRLLDGCAPYLGTEEASGFNTFDQSLYTKGLSEGWQRRIDMRMRGHVEAELTGRSKPRAEHEAADSWYARSVLQCMHGNLVRPLDLFEDQLRFIASWRRWSPNVLSAVRMPLDRIFLHLRERGGPGSVCHAVIRRVVLEGSADARYAIRSSADLELARRWLELYGPSDPELLEHLRFLIAASASRIDAQSRVEEEAKSKESAAEAALR